MRNASKMARYMMMRPNREPGAKQRGEMRGNEMRGGGYAENRYGDDRYPYQRGGEMRHNGAEQRDRYDVDQRRRRYDNGRFAPRNEMDGDMDMAGEEMSGGEEMYGGAMNVIGFDTRTRMGGSKKKSGGQKRGYASGGEGEEFDEKKAREWTHRMKNADGTQGEKWSMEQARQVMMQRGIKAEPAEFYAILNAMYSDYSKVAQKHGVSGIDFFADLAKAWLDDEDAVEDKAAMYYECVVKH